MQLFHLTKSAVNQIAKTVQAKIKFGLKAGLKFDLPVLGLAGCHGRKWKRLSRYVDWASPIHITVQQMRLRWMETSEAHSIPLLSEKFYIFTDGSHTHTLQPATQLSNLAFFSGWWLGTFLSFPYIGNNHSNWLIFFRGVGQPPTSFYCLLFSYWRTNVGVLSGETPELRHHSQRDPRDERGIFDWWLVTKNPGILGIGDSETPPTSVFFFSEAAWKGLLELLVMAQWHVDGIWTPSK